MGNTSATIQAVSCVLFVRSFVSSTACFGASRVTAFWAYSVSCCATRGWTILRHTFAQGRRGLGMFDDVKRGGEEQCCEIDMVLLYTLEWEANFI